MHSKKIGKIFGSVLAATLASTSALAVSADKTAVVIGGYATDGLTARLESAGYAVTLAAQSTGMLSSLGDFDQVWDLRFMDALSVADNGAYLSYLQNAGGLFLIGEHAGFADRNNSLVNFITAAGGGDVTYAANTINTQYVTSPFNGDAVVVADSSTPMSIPSAGTVATPGNGVFITTSGPNGTGVGTGVAFGVGSLTNALDGRLLTYFDVDTFSSGTIGSNAAVRALVDRMISFVAGDFQADPDLGGSGVIDTSKGEFTLADAAAQGATVTFDGGTLSMTGGASPDVILSNPIAIQDGGAFINTAGVTSTLSGVVSGDGGLIVQGQGTLVLTGANNYAGGTVIADSSTVRVSDGGALGTGGLNLMGGTLAAGADFAMGTNIQLAGGVANAIDTAGHDVVLNGAVSGAGGLIVQGGGTLTLAGANNHAGGVGIIGDSTVRVSDGGALGSGVLILSGGTLAADAGFATGTNIQLAGGATNAIDTAGHDVVLNGAVSGAGGLIVQGGGTLTLAGANNHAGGVGITGDSTVRVSDGGALGTGGLNLMGGTLAAGADFATGTNIQLAGGVANAIDTAGHDVVLNGAVSGAGGLIVQGGGTLTLAGTNNHAGGVGITGDSTVRVSDGGALGSGALVLSGGTLAADAGFATGANVQLLNATGNLIDTNGHTVVLTGAISGTGGLIKAGDGRLNLTGVNDYSGDTQVNGGRLAMNGTAVNSSFTVNAGGSIGGNGTVGSLVVGNGATAAPGNSIGQLTAATTVLFEAGSTYEVEIDASGASDRLLASETVTIEGGTVQVLAASGDYAPRTSYAIIAAGDGVTGTFDTVTSDLAFLTPSLTYASNGVVLTMTRNDVRFADVGVTFNQRSTAAAVDGAFDATSALYNELVGMNAGGARQAFDALSGEVHASALSFAAADADNVRRTLIGRFDGPAATGTEMWTTVTGNWNDIDGNGNSAAVSGNGQGFLTGVETDLAGFRVGVAGGYTDGDARIRARGAQADVRNLHVGVYGGGAFGKLRVRAGAVHTTVDVRTDRQVNVGALSETLRAKYDGQAAQAFGELGYAMPLGNGTVEPFAGINALWLKNEAFTETGGTLALEGAERTRDTIWSNLGFKASFALGANSPLTAQVKGVWQHALTDRATDSRLTFANGGSSFLVHGAPLARDAAAVDASLRWQVADRVQVGVGYAGTIADQGESQSVRLTLGVRF